MGCVDARRCFRWDRSGILFDSVSVWSFLIVVTSALDYQPTNIPNPDRATLDVGLLEQLVYSQPRLLFYCSIIVHLAHLRPKY